MIDLVPYLIHDAAAAIKYAHLLEDVVDYVSSYLCIIVRCHVEKPRTTVGWKWLINDPALNETSQINKGLKVTRQSLISSVLGSRLRVRPWISSLRNSRQISLVLVLLAQG